jgi:hypothetical protein
MKIYVLGMRREGRKDTPIMKLFLALWTFADITTVTTFINTLVTCFCRKRRFHMTTKLQSSRRPSVHPSGNPQGSEGYSRGRKSPELPQDEAAQ